MRASHIGGCPCFVDKDQALRLQIKLATKPRKSPRKNVRPILLYRVAGLFLRVMLWRTKKRSKLDLLVRTPFSAKAALISISVASALLS